MRGVRQGAGTHIRGGPRPTGAHADGGGPYCRPGPPVPPMPETRQFLVEGLIDEGLLARHIRKMRTEYKSRHERVLEVLAGQADWLRPIKSTAGMHLSALLPPGRHLSTKAVLQRTAGSGAAANSLSAFYAGDAHPIRSRPRLQAHWPGEDRERGTATPALAGLLVGGQRTAGLRRRADETPTIQGWTRSISVCVQRPVFTRGTAALRRRRTSRR